MTGFDEPNGAATFPACSPRSDGCSSDRRVGPTHFEILCLFLILVLAIPLRLGDINDPWSQKGWQHLNALFAIMGRNYVENGYMTTRFAPATDGVVPEDGEWQLFLHHPPLFPLLLSLSFHVFGVHEWSARLVSIAGSLLGLLALWALTRRLFGWKAALLAAAFAAVVPATAFYGSHVCEMGPVLVGFGVLAFALHLRYLEQPTRRLFVCILLALFVSAYNDWPGFYMMGVILVHFAWVRRWREALWITGLVAAVLALHVLHVRWATGSFGGGRGGSLAEAFNVRSWGALEAYGGPVVALRIIGQHIIRLYTLPVVVLALIGIAWIRKAGRPVAVLALIVAGTADTLIFVEGAGRHEFWVVTLAPPLIVLAGAGAAGLMDLFPFRKTASMILVVGTLAILSLVAFNTHQRFQGIKSRFFYTLGTLMEKQTEPGSYVGTCELQADPLVYYARRHVKGFWQDHLIPETGLPPSLAPIRKVFIPEKMFVPHGHEKMLELLQAEYPYEMVETEACGKVFIFDVTRKLDK